MGRGALDTNTEGGLDGRLLYVKSRDRRCAQSQYSSVGRASETRGGGGGILFCLIPFPEHHRSVGRAWLAGGRAEDSVIGANSLFPGWFI